LPHAFLQTVDIAQDAVVLIPCLTGVDPVPQSEHTPAERLDLLRVDWPQIAPLPWQIFADALEGALDRFLTTVARGKLVQTRKVLLNLQ
jgi:hypothetical protein